MWAESDADLCLHGVRTHKMRLQIPQQICAEENASSSSSWSVSSLEALQKMSGWRRDNHDERITHLSLAILTMVEARDATNIEEKTNDNGCASLV